MISKLTHTLWGPNGTLESENCQVVGSGVVGDDDICFFIPSDYMSGVSEGRLWAPAEPSNNLQTVYCFFPIADSTISFGSAALASSASRTALPASSPISSAALTAPTMACSAA
jgi:hypothetical protein